MWSLLRTFLPNLVLFVFGFFVSGGLGGGWGAVSLLGSGFLFGLVFWLGVFFGGLGGWFTLGGGVLVFFHETQGDHL